MVVEKQFLNNLSLIFTGTASTPISGAPPSVLSPTPVAGFPIAQANGQAQEIYANGIPYTGTFTLNKINK